MGGYFRSDDDFRLNVRFHFRTDRRKGIALRVLRVQNNRILHNSCIDVFLLDGIDGIPADCLSRKQNALIVPVPADFNAGICQHFIGGDYIVKGNISCI